MIQERFGKWFNISARDGNAQQKLKHFIIRKGVTTLFKKARF
jgi:hypothetical protein